MFKKLCTVSFPALVCAFGVSYGSAQMVVHALSGTVQATDAKANTMSVIANDGSKKMFSTAGSSGSAADLNNELRNGTVSASGFSKVGDQVIVYYTGYGDSRTAVALRDLGPGPFVKATGKVVHFDKHSHVLTLKPADGPVQQFHLDDKTVAETMLGAVQGDKADLEKGTEVRVTGSAENGSNTARFIRST